MKVNSSAGFNQYKTYVQEMKKSETAAGKVNGESRSVSAGTANTDKVMFSGSATAQAELDRVAKAVASEVENIGSDAHLSQLQEQVAQGSYFVETDTLVSSILGEA